MTREFPSTSQSTSERLQVRLDADTKRLLERAAAYSGTSVSDFIRTHAREAAKAVIAENEQLPLVPADWEVFLRAIEAPPEPAPALRAAVAAYLARSAAI